MNRFSRIRHHVDMRDIKEKCLHEIVVKKIKEEKDRKEKNIIQEISKKYKSNWRNELDEGMTVAGFMKTVVPSEGDEALVNNDTKNINDGSVPYPLNPTDANALTGVSDIFAPGPANVIDPNGKGHNEGLPYGTGSGGGFGGGRVWASSTLASSNNSDAGNGENSGFDMGGPYARMRDEVGGPSFGTIPYRYLTLASTDTTELSHLRITAIQGNNPTNTVGNGGASGWNNNGAKEQSSIRVRYWVPGMSDFQYLSVNPQGQTTRGQFDQDPSSSGYQLNPTDVIVSYDANASTPTNFSIELPEYVRDKDVRFQLYQRRTVPNGSPFGQHWGVSNISYQRKTPISVFVSLDSPEASSFIRIGQGSNKTSSPKKRKKRVEDILSAGKEYTNKYLGSDFPGSSTELSPETPPEVSSIDQEIADIQQQSRDSMSQQTKDRFEKTPETTPETKTYTDADFEIDPLVRNKMLGPYNEKTSYSFEIGDNNSYPIEELIQLSKEHPVKFSEYKQFSDNLRDQKVSLVKDLDNARENFYNKQDDIIRSYRDPITKTNPLSKIYNDYYNDLRQNPTVEFDYAKSFGREIGDELYKSKTAYNRHLQIASSDDYRGDSISVSTKGKSEQWLKESERLQEEIKIFERAQEFYDKRVASLSEEVFNYRNDTLNRYYDIRRSMENDPESQKFKMQNRSEYAEGSSYLNLKQYLGIEKEYPLDFYSYDDFIDTYKQFGKDDPFFTEYFADYINEIEPSDLESPVKSLNQDELKKLDQIGIKKDVIDIFIKKGQTETLRQLLVGQIEAGAFTPNEKKRTTILGFEIPLLLDLKVQLTAKYLLGLQNKTKPFTKVNNKQGEIIAAGIADLFRRQDEYDRTGKGIFRSATNAEPGFTRVVQNVTTEDNKGRYKLKDGEEVFRIASYLGHSTGVSDEARALQTLFGGFVVITQTGYDSNGKLIKIIKSIRDDFDFTYGYETGRGADGSVAGDPYYRKVYGSMKDEPYTDPTTGRPKVGAMDHATSAGSEVGSGEYEGFATIGRSIVWTDRITSRFTGTRGGNPVPLNIDLTKHYRGNTLPLGDMQQYANESRTYSKIKELLRERNKA